MFPMQNFEPTSAVISAASNTALIEKYLRNTCLGQGAVPTLSPNYLELFGGEGESLKIAMGATAQAIVSYFFCCYL